MRWIKKGKIFEASGQAGWMNSHAQIPTVLVLDDRLRIYFSTRPEPGVSLTTFVDVDVEAPENILYLHDKPILELGPPGSFDEHGLMPSCVIQRDSRVWLYYGGWSRRSSIPYSNWTGLAFSDDGGMSFTKAFAGPVVDRTPDEIFSATAVFVLPDVDKWHMWYASGTEWIDVNGKFEEIYVIKHGVSADGIRWRRDNKQILSSVRRKEPTHRPTVVEVDGTYHMWFSHRGVEDFRDGANSYRIGYAKSRDLEHWQRDDDAAGITVSETGWDSMMNAYPYVVRARDKYYLFYNGNGFGAAGFGYAILDF